ncbi:MAG: HNH endonuclease [Oscillochloridaceae bacterium umkhey_bin13]
MSRPYISVQLAAQIMADAGHCCGYCRAEERLTGSRLSIEHLVPIAAGGSSERSNLWHSCRECNERKGAQLQVLDPLSGERVDLFNPRTQSWLAHFRWSDDGLQIVGQTAIGRATVAALDLNRAHLLVARQRWVLVGWHPPAEDLEEGQDEQLRS